MKPKRNALLCLTALIVSSVSWAAASGQKEEKEPPLPLEPTRTIELTTEEATWLSVDVSPDGRTIVMEILGDLYLLDADGGEARRITSGLAFDTQPRFSPDGERLAFLSDRDGAENVWIADAEGRDAKKLSADTDAEFASPTWSADGSYVIASRAAKGFGTFELWTYHVAGGSGVAITKAKPQPTTPRDQRHNAIGAVASPDGRYLYYARKSGGFQYNANFPLWQIARRDLVTGDEDVLTQALGSAIRPALSPDGTKLVYGTRFDAETGLRIRDLETGVDRWLAYPVQRDDQEARFTRDLLPGYAFTPDGSAVVASYGGRLYRIDLASGASTPIPFTARIEQSLGPALRFPRRVEEGPVRARIIQDPSPSPDGARLAFSALTRLYVMDVSGGAPRRVLGPDERGFQPTWSPDGAWIAYVGWSDGEGHVYKVRPDGRDRRRLTTTPAFYTDPAWSPDGERIAALRGAAYDRLYRPVDFGSLPGMDLVAIPAEGGPASLVLPARGVGKPHFTSDPDRIYLYLSGGGFGPAGGAHGLFSVRWDGTDRREHARVTGPGIYFHEEPVSADDARISPDGKWLLAHVGNQLYVAAVPSIGGEPPTIDVTKPNVPTKRLTDVGADYFTWADGGETIGWAIGASFFERPLASVDFTAGADEDDGEEETSEAAAAARREEESSVSRVDVDVEAERSIPSGTIVLRGARVVTMRGDEVVEDADVVVTNERIASVGPRADAPEGARVVDVSGHTIVPGFVDSHAHWFEIRRGVLDPSNWSFLANLAYGVTAGLDVQTSTNDMFAPPPRGAVRSRARRAPS